MNEEKGRPLDTELRAALLGALSHELRTPLTSLGMLLDLARRQAEREGQATLDPELLRMFELSLRDLQRLADGVQEVSRIERGLWRVRPEPTTVAAVLEQAGAATPNVRLESSGDTGTAVRWDPQRVAGALADLAVTANRLGAGSGAVLVDVRRVPSGVAIRLRSGDRMGEPLAFGTDAGFRYFRATFLLSLMGGAVVAERTDGYVQIEVELPAGGEGS